MDIRGVIWVTITVAVAGAALGLFAAVRVGARSERSMKAARASTIGEVDSWPGADGRPKP
jgi:hypothetical protein